MDFNVNAVNRILAALARIEAALKASTGYTERHILNLGAASVVETSGISGLLGLLSVTTELIGSIAGISTVEGALGIYLSKSSAAASTTVIGALSLIRELAGLVNAEVVITGVLQGTSTFIAGASNAISGANGSLNLRWCAGSVSAGSNVNGWLTGVD